MALTNHQIGQLLKSIADFLELNEDNPFRVRAYRRAARSVQRYVTDISTMVDNKENLKIIPYVGKGIAAQIKIITETEKIPEIKLKTPEKVFEQQLKSIAGLGPKRIQLLRTHLNIHTKQDLIAAFENNKLDSIKGFGKKLQQKILDSIKHPTPYERYFKLNMTEFIIKNFVEHLNTIKEIEKITAASAYRRKVERVGTVKIIVLSSQITIVIEKILKFSEIMDLISAEEKYLSVILRTGLRIDINFVNQESYATALLFATGSDTHVQTLLTIAKQNQIILTEQGLFHHEKKIIIHHEEEIYKKLGLSFIEPELRENRGEIQAAQQATLPNLITLADIKGDLHAHTNETDGTESLETMVEIAMEKGYQYLAITDHSQSLKITRGLDEYRLRKQMELIDELNSHLKNFRILKSSEIDILEDGSLDFPDSILKELDLRVCSIHSRFKLAEEEQTERIIRAMDNPYFNILGHMTGRLLIRRPPYPVNVTRIFTAAKERGCIIELNAQPSRLDINDSYCLLAKQMGVKIAISTDSHSITEMDNMKFGIFQARRGWLEAHDVVNTLDLTNLKKLLKRI